MGLMYDNKRHSKRVRECWHDCTCCVLRRSWVDPRSFGAKNFDPAASFKICNAVELDVQGLGPCVRMWVASQAKGLRAWRQRSTVICASVKAPVKSPAPVTDQAHGSELWVRSHIFLCNSKSNCACQSPCSGSPGRSTDQDQRAVGRRSREGTCNTPGPELQPQLK